MSGVIERWRPYLLSISLHAGLIAIIVVVGMDGWRTPPPPSVLAIEAVAIDSAELARLERAARRSPAARPVEAEPRAAPEPSVVPEPQAAPSQAQPEPSVAAEDRRRAEEAQRVERERRAETQRLAERERRAEAERRAERERRAEAERRAQQQRVEEQRREEDARIRAEREAALQRELAAEVSAAQAAEAQRAAAARAASLSAQWAAAIQGRVQRAWIRPSSAVPGLDCRVTVTQAPGGSVLRAEVRSCNGDDAVRQSIEAAVFRASPLPPPPEPQLFERIIELRFRPND
jgi:colicin import membrane protein